MAIGVSLFSYIVLKKIEYRILHISIIRSSQFECM